jgi:hypothetical protein
MQKPIASGPAMDGHLLWIILAAVSLPIGLGLFLASWYHGWKMFMHRNGDWRGYYVPFGFLLDATLDAEGLEHRRKMLKYLALALPFIVVVLLNAYLGQSST